MSKTKKISFALAVFVVILGVFLYFYSLQDASPTEVSSERLTEIESMKDKSFYEDSVLDDLGKTKSQITSKYGQPDEIQDHYLGGEELYYEDLKTTFVFAGDENIVNNMHLGEGREILGVEVGMTFDEIEDVLGEPRIRDFDDPYQEYILVYFLGDQTDGLGELELWFSAQSDDVPTESLSVFWKKYWE